MSKFLSKYHTVSICNPSVFPKGRPEFEFFPCILRDQSGPGSAGGMPAERPGRPLPIVAVALLRGLGKKQSKD